MIIPPVTDNYPRVIRLERTFYSVVAQTLSRAAITARFGHARKTAKHTARIGANLGHRFSKSS